MKILVENSGYHLLNMGDLAMLQVAIKRLKDLFPEASVAVFTNHPTRLVECCPDTIPVLPKGRNVWVSKRLIRKFYKVPFVKEVWFRLEEELQYKFPKLYSNFLKAKLRRDPVLVKQIEEFYSIFQPSDLVVSTGGGYVTDAFMSETTAKLDMLSLASKLGKPTAMLGQGVGPLKNEENLKKVASVLPRIDVISLRESKTSLPLLQSLGIPKDKLVVTGDDAIELSFKLRSENLEKNVGVNLRVAKYSNVTKNSIQSLQIVLQGFARSKDIDLLPVPIDRASFNEYIDSDMTSIQNILKGFDDNSDGGTSLDTPEKVIRQVGKCRVVVTGSYHGGVFALAQGIPVIGLAKSQYYIDKFAGLAGQFPNGCKILLLDSPSFEEELESSLEHFWNTAEQLRESLLEAAQKQVELSQSVYRKLADLVKS